MSSDVDEALWQHRYAEFLKAQTVWREAGVIDSPERRTGLQSTLKFPLMSGRGEGQLVIVGTEDQALVFFKEFADWSLRGLHFGVTQDVTKWVSGLAMCGHTANRLQSAIRDHKPIKWARGKGMTFGMYIRFNLVAFIFFVMLAAAGGLNVIADVPSLQSVYAKYRVIPSLLAISCLGLIFFNYAQLIARGYKQHNLHRVWDRLEFAHRTTESRGIKLVELVSIPLALVVPIPAAIEWLRVYVGSL